ncbi:unnamed protein product [Kluyveromyces dobzhanskii CBS 2104]|uniref:Elongator complex protein 4 n=1 Tax=Kluyveromyces dobzhanskii CBS 2104 TaxID=1427455 RepID=A0A0A8LAD6_9SACH|nr:unnamed protein product [Kluyveromyces dobzhanskii CBS 2104]
MSFRKRCEVLSDGSGSKRNAAPPSPGGLQRELPSRNAPQRRLPAMNRGQIGGAVVGRVVSNAGSIHRDMNGLHIGGISSHTGQQIDGSTSLNLSHPGIRPSPATSQQTTSIGCADLDKLMGHMGFPLGCSLLIEEESTTDFNSVLSKVYASQGIVHNRVEGSRGFKDGNTHLIVLSLNHHLTKELPGVYKGSRKDIKKSKIAKEQSKVTVSNLLESQSTPTSSGQRSKDLKIAWRYGINDDATTSKSSREYDQSETYPDYNHQFDITSNLIPAPTSNEISFISPLLSVSSVLSQVVSTIKRHDSKLIRILLPNLLHPALYPPKMTQLHEIIPLLHGLRSILKNYKERCVLLSTISTSLFNNQPLFMAQIEQLFDGVINLEPFGQEMLQLLEKAYKSQPNKIQHGLVHIKKLPVFSERGEMHVAKSEWAFKNGRKKFEIEEWGIPVEDDEDTSKKDKESPARKAQPFQDEHQHSHTKNLDF